MHLAMDKKCPHLQQSACAGMRREDKLAEDATASPVHGTVFPDGAQMACWASQTKGPTHGTSILNERAQCSRLKLSNGGERAT